jgi:hypothetical protein
LTIIIYFEKEQTFLTQFFFFKKLIIAEPSEKSWQELPTPAKRWDGGAKIYVTFKTLYV